MCADLINVFSTLQECRRENGDVHETELDRARGQLEHDSVIGLRDANQPFRRAGSEQLARTSEILREKKKRDKTDEQESVERCPGIIDPTMDHGSRASEAQSVKH